MCAANAHSVTVTQLCNMWKNVNCLYTLTSWYDIINDMVYDMIYNMKGYDTVYDMIYINKKSERCVLIYRLF